MPLTKSEVRGRMERSVIREHSLIARAAPGTALRFIRATN